MMIEYFWAENKLDLQLQKGVFLCLDNLKWNDKIHRTIMRNVEANNWKWK